MVQAHRVEAKIGDTVCHNLGVFLLWKAGAETEVRAPEPRAGAVLEVEMPVLDLDEAVLAGRGIEDVLAGVEGAGRHTHVIRRCRRVGGEPIGEPSLFGEARGRAYH